MRPLYSRIAMICAVAMVVWFGSAVRPAAAQTQPDRPIPTPEAYKASLPSDVHPETGNRFPKAKREELDDQGKKLFDALPANSRGGPGSIRIY
ncbi:MAG: hypothetical protein ACRD88_19390, partial [Terriglobia bacterium]